MPLRTIHAGDAVDFLRLVLPLGDGKSGEVLVDTGSPLGISLPTAKWEEWKAAHPSALTKEATYYVAGAGSVSREIVWADKVTIGPLTFTDVPVTEAAPVEMATISEYAGSIGLWGLKRMTLAVDGKNGFAYIQLRPPAGWLNAWREWWNNEQSQGVTDWTVGDGVRINGDQFTLDAIKSSINAGDFKNAVANCDRLLASNPQNTDALFRRAVAESAMGQVPEAEADYKRVVELDPLCGQAYIKRAELRKNSGNVTGATADYDHAIAFAPSRSEIYRLRANARRDSGDPTGALADYAKAIQLGTADAGVFADRSLANRQLGNFAAAISDATRAIEMEPHNLAAWVRRGEAKNLLGDQTGAIADFVRAIEMDPQNFWPYYDRAQVECAQGETAAAKADYTRAQQIDPQSADAYRGRGDVEQIQGDWAGALADYDKVLELKPASSAGMALIYRHYLRLRLGIADEGFANLVAGWSDGWMKTEGLFAAHKLTEADFLTAASSMDGAAVLPRECAAYFFVGLQHGQEGDMAGAANF